MSTPRTTLALLPLVCLTAGGCTAIILSDAAQDADLPCDAAADCGAGFECKGGACAEVTEDGSAPPAPGVVGEEGGTLRGPDGMTITLPEGALATTVRFSISRGSETTLPRTEDADIAPGSRFYVVEPPLALDVDATVVLPLTGTCAGCQIFVEGEDGEWLALADSDVEGLEITATTDVLGAFVAGESE